MSEISEYESRISAALERIGRLSETGAGSSSAVQALEQALGEEKTANAQLEHRLGSLTARLASTEDGGHAELESVKEGLSGLDRELSRLRSVNAQLREINGQLREANEAGVGEPHLINKAMLTELEALRVTQAADRAEMDAILSQLRPLVGEGENA